MKTFDNLRLYHLFAWSVLTAAVTLLPLPDLAGSGPAWKDKAAHFLLFGGLALFILRYLALFPKTGKWPSISIAIGASSAYALLIELLQSYIPGRSPSIWDLIAGALGAVIASNAIFFVNRQKL